MEPVTKGAPTISLQQAPIRTGCPDDTGEAKDAGCLPCLQADAKAILKVFANVSRDLKDYTAACETDLAKARKAFAALKPAVQQLFSFDLCRLVEDSGKWLSAEVDNAIARRRERLHHLARENGVSIRQVDKHDQVDVLKVEYQGPKVTISLGQYRIVNIEVYRGEELFVCLQGILDSLKSRVFDRSIFIRELDYAVRIMLTPAPGGDGRGPSARQEGYVLIRDLPNFFLFARNQLALHKPKTDRCPLEWLIYDLARFIHDGTEEAGLRLETRQPVAANAQEAVNIPNLRHPSEHGQPARLLRIVRI